MKIYSAPALYKWEKCMNLSNSHVRALEEQVRSFLYNANAPVLNFALFTSLQSAGAITAQQFNRLIADLKRAGVVGTARGGEVIFLSVAARQQRNLELSKAKKIAGEVQS